MCERYALALDQSFFRRYQTRNRLPLVAHYNVAPSSTMPVIVRHSSNSVALMRWGLISFVEEKQGKPRQLPNLRAETLIAKAGAHQYLQLQRCLVPATGFFVWKKTAIGKSIPYHLLLKTDGYFSFAGLYSTYTQPKSGNTVTSYAIITTTPNSLIEAMHDRMPVMLSQADEAAWLNPDLAEIEQLKPFLKPYPAAEMAAYLVSPRVNYLGNDDQELIKPVKQPTKQPA